MQFLDYSLEGTCDFNITMVKKQVIAVAYPEFFEHTRYWRWGWHFIYVTNIVSVLGSEE